MGHFRDRKKSEERAEEAIRICDKDAFERVMHQFHDYWSHIKEGYRWWPFHGLHPKHWDFGHSFAGIEPDNDMEAWGHANEATKAKVDEWDQNCCKFGGHYNIRPQGPCAGRRRSDKFTIWTSDIFTIKERNMFTIIRSLILVSILFSQGCLGGGIEIYDFMSEKEMKIKPNG